MVIFNTRETCWPILSNLFTDIANPAIDNGSKGADVLKTAKKEQSVRLETLRIE